MLAAQSLARGAAPLRALVRARAAAALPPRALAAAALHASAPAAQREAKTKARKPDAAAAKAAPAAPRGDDADEDEAGEGGGEKDKSLGGMLARACDYARRELGKLRGATASPALLDHVRVDAYGESQGLRDVAQVSLKGAAMLVVNPFDGALAGAIADAIRDADLGLNPAVDGDVVRVPVPKASKETRDAAAKLASKIAEHAKTRARRARAAALEKLKKAALPEDDARREEKAVEEAVAAAVADIAKQADAKRAEIERA